MLFMPARIMSFYGNFNTLIIVSRSRVNIVTKNASYKKHWINLCIIMPSLLTRSALVIHGNFTALTVKILALAKTKLEL